jgi:hypothetical protein
MPALGAGIHDLSWREPKSWMAGPSPTMTKNIPARTKNGRPRRKRPGHDEKRTAMTSTRPRPATSSCLLASALPRPARRPPLSCPPRSSSYPPSSLVMPALGAGIHDLSWREPKSWMAGPSPTMTKNNPAKTKTAWPKRKTAGQNEKRAAKTKKAWPKRKPITKRRRDGHRDSLDNHERYQGTLPMPPWLVFPSVAPVPTIGPWPCGTGWIRTRPAQGQRRGKPRVAAASAGTGFRLALRAGSRPPLSLLRISSDAGGAPLSS